MYHYMTTELINICPKVLVVQEGGYNVDYLGQHAEGVMRALLKKEMSELTQADRDAGLKEGISEVQSNDAKEWAKEDVEKTRNMLRGLWKCT